MIPEDINDKTFKDLAWDVIFTGITIYLLDKGLQYIVYFFFDLMLKIGGRLL